MPTAITSATEWVKGSRGDQRFLAPHPLLFVPQLIWIAGALATMLLPNPRTAVLVVSIMSMAWTVAYVHRTGGPYLTPSAVYFLASGVFIGIAGWYLLNVELMDSSMHDLRMAVMLAFVLTVLTELAVAAFCVRWRVSWRKPNKIERSLTDFRAPRQLVLRGFVLLGISRLPQVIALSYELASAIGLAGLLILVVASFSLRHRIRWVGDIMIVLAGFVMPLLWVSAVFRGGGRLTVAGLGVALVLTWNLVRPARWHKVALVVAIPIFLVVAGLNRLDKIEEEWGVTTEADTSAVIAGGEGLQSVYDPLDKWSLILSQDEFVGGTIGPRYGATFVNTVLMPVPRSAWEGKPKGFGAELTEVISPSMVSRGQSYAALTYSEWYANFGYVGLALVPLATGWFLAKIDQMHSRLVISRLRTSRDWWQTVVLACVVTSLSDLFWVGTFTFYARGGLAALIAWSVGALSMRRQRSFETVTEDETPEERVEAPVGAFASGIAR